MDIIENLVQAVSILNKTEEYLESLPDRLSECDRLISDYEHLIENNDTSEIDLKKLYNEMKNVLKKIIERKNQKIRSIKKYKTKNQN